MNETKNRPVTSVRVGSVRAAAWRNQHQGCDGQGFASIRVILERTYRDRSGNYNSTQGLGVNDIPKAILALVQVYQYLMEHHDGEETGDEPVSPTKLP